MSDSIIIEKARETDRQAILDVMRPWNMHHVPSVEMEEMDLTTYFVARKDGKIIGAAGYAILSQTIGKTTLLGVLPEYQGSGTGKRLQNKRLEAMHRLGVKTVITNTDRPATIKWLKESYGFRETGILKKLMSFGDSYIDHWTTLELDLRAYMAKRDREAATREYIARNEPHPLAPYPPLLINVCLTGMIPTKDKTQFVPLSVEEIIEDAIRMADAGAQIVHIHARDEEAKPTWRGDIYARILGAIRRERPSLVLCVSTSGRLWNDFERRSEVLQLTADSKPDMASLTLGSMNFPTGPSVNAPEMIQRLAQTMREKEIVPELEAFDLGMVSYARYLERHGLLPRAKYFNLLLGNLGTLPATIGNLSSMTAALPENSVWAAAGIGHFQLPMNAAGIVAGGGVRVGLEDNIYYDNGRARLASNEELVRRVIRIAEEMARPLATSEEARQMVGI